MKNQKNQKFFNEKLIDELSIFESFFHNSGLKRIDGLVYGLLTLSERPLSSEEIEQTLNLSQSAVCLALKNLDRIAATQTVDSRQERSKLHTTRENSLSTVASIFRKREQLHVEEFKMMALRVMKTSKIDGKRNSPVTKRMESIIATCELAEAVMNFVIKISHSSTGGQYAQIAAKLPSILNTIEQKIIPISTLTSQLKSNFTEKIRDGISRLTGDI